MDDDEQITGEWLMEVGFFKKPYASWSVFSLGGCHLVSWDGSWRLFVGHSNVILNDWVRFDPTTRGTVRAMLRFLGGRAAEAKATNGPWQFRPADITGPPDVAKDWGGNFQSLAMMEYSGYCDVPETIQGQEAVLNGQFIALTRNSLPALLAIIDRLVGNDDAKNSTDQP